MVKLCWWITSNILPGANFVPHNHMINFALNCLIKRYFPIYFESYTWSVVYWCHLWAKQASWQQTLLLQIFQDMLSERSIVVVHGQWPKEECCQVKMAEWPRVQPRTDWSQLSIAVQPSDNERNAQFSIKWKCFDYSPDIRPWQQCHNEDRDHAQLPLGPHVKQGWDVLIRHWKLLPSLVPEDQGIEDHGDGTSHRNQEGHYVKFAKTQNFEA